MASYGCASVLHFLHIVWFGSLTHAMMISSVGTRAEASVAEQNHTCSPILSSGHRMFSVDVHRCMKLDVMLFSLWEYQLHAARVFTCLQIRSFSELTEGRVTEIRIRILVDSPMLVRCSVCLRSAAKCKADINFRSADSSAPGAVRINTCYTC